MIIVIYTDGTEESFGSVKEAESAIYEAMVFSNFGKTVDEVFEDTNGKRTPLYCNWSLKLVST